MRSVPHDTCSVTGMNAVHSKAVKPGHNRLAFFVNNLVNPLTIGPVLLGLVAAHAGMTGILFSKVLVTSILGYSIVPLILLLVLKRRGRIASIEARDRQRRSRALWSGSLLMLLVSLAVIWAAGGGYSSIAVVSGMVAINTALAALINERFKMSLHVASVTTLCSFLAALSVLSSTPVPGSEWTLVVTFILIPVAMWGRLTDRAHSRYEVAAGCLFGVVVPPLELLLVNTFWPLF